MDCAFRQEDIARQNYSISTAKIPQTDEPPRGKRSVRSASQPAQ
jgi:hypothetical protein